MQRTVADDWEATSDHPIRLRAGDQVQVGERGDTWPQYQHCVGPDGREGWVPDDVLSKDSRGWVAALPYDARELTVRTGDVVDALRFMADWWWCRDRHGAEGWVPEQVLV